MLEFWEKHKATIIKIALIAVLIPILIPVGMILFSVTSFILSIVLFIVVLLFIVGLGLVAWSVIEEKLYASNVQKQQQEKSTVTKEVIVIEAEATEVTETTEAPKKATQKKPKETGESAE